MVPPTNRETLKGFLGSRAMDATGVLTKDVRS